MTLSSERIADHLAGRPIMVVGRAGMDIYPMPDGTRVEDAQELVNDVGGSSGNIAVSIAKQGHPVMLLSAVSNDGVGRFVTRSLGEYGVAPRHCFVTTGLERTSLAMAETTTDSPDVTIYRNDAADLAITPAHAEAVDVAALGAIIITGTALSREPSRSACERLVELAGDAGCPVVLDIDYRVQAWASPDEARKILAGMAARQPCGSGEAVLGTTLATLAAGPGSSAAVTRGAAAAAIAVSRRGCARAMPTAGEIDSFMESHAMDSTDAATD